MGIGIGIRADQRSSGATQFTQTARNEKVMRRKTKTKTKMTRPRHVNGLSPHTSIPSTNPLVTTLPQPAPYCDYYRTVQPYLPDIFDGRLTFFGGRVRSSLCPYLETCSLTCECGQLVTRAQQSNRPTHVAISSSLGALAPFPLPVISFTHSPIACLAPPDVAGPDPPGSPAETGAAAAAAGVSALCSCRCAAANLDVNMDRRLDCA